MHSTDHSVQFLLIFLKCCRCWLWFTFRISFRLCQICEKSTSTRCTWIAWHGGMEPRWWWGGGLHCYQSSVNSLISLSTADIEWIVAQCGGWQCSHMSLQSEPQNDINQTDFILVTESPWHRGILWTRKRFAGWSRLPCSRKNTFQDCFGTRMSVSDSLLMAAVCLGHPSAFYLKVNHLIPLSPA